MKRETQKENTSVGMRDDALSIELQGILEVWD